MLRPSYYFVVLMIIVAPQTSAQPYVDYVLTDIAPKELAVDNTGTMWITSEDDLLSYDGTDLIFYPDYKYRVISTTIDNTGQFWFIGYTKNAFSYSLYYRSNSQFQNALTLPEDIYGLTIYDIAIYDDTYWIMAEEGLLQWNGATWVTHTMVDGLQIVHPRSAAVDSSGSFWVGTPYGIAAFDGTTWTAYTEEDGLPGNFILSIFVDSNGAIWCCAGGGLSRFEDNVWVNYQNKVQYDDYQDEFYIEAITENKEGVIWFGHATGVGRLIDSTLSDLRTNENVSFPERHIDVIACDNNGTIWCVSTTEPGMYRNGMLRIREDDVQVEDTTYLPQSLSLSCFPNPFNPATTIGFTLSESAPVTLAVYNLAGQKVETLVEGPMSTGTHAVVFDGSGLASGVYVYRLDSPGYSNTGKMLLVK